MSTQQLADFWSVVAGTGNDPELDTLLCITIVVSGARREGLIRLSLGDLNRVNGTILLDEKNRKALPQPVPDWLLYELEVFARSRGARKPTDKVLRLERRPGQLAGNVITSRRLDNIFQRVQSSLPWADEAQLTAHTLRHHAIGLVERHAGSQVAAAFARHEPDGTTAGYGRASDEEVAQAVIDLHGGKHPWVERQDGVDASDQNGQDESAFEGEDDSVVDE